MWPCIAFLRAGPCLSSERSVIVNQSLTSSSYWNQLPPLKEGGTLALKRSPGFSRLLLENELAFF